MIGGYRKHLAKHCVAGIIALCSTSLIADQRYPGGKTTTGVQGANAFSQPAANLSFDKRLDFSVGNSFFRNPWVSAPATTDARDGLGPLFNTNSCQSCHIKDGRGHPPSESQPNSASTILKIGLSEHSDEGRGKRKRPKHVGFLPTANYGGQIQDFALPGVAPELRINWTWQSVPFQTSEEKEIELRRPSIKFDQLAYGPLPKNLMVSPRVAPGMIGLGLIEAIPEAAILANADPEDTDGNGISGRPSRVWDSKSQKLVLGRFGWKAAKPDVEQQVAGAFFGDMGLTSKFHTDPTCTTVQKDCLAAPHGGSPEVTDEVLAAVTFYSKHLATPARPNALNEQILKGAQIFADVGCADCHQPKWQTAKSDSPALQDQTIYPYSDFLLHDMGEGLADNFTEFNASGTEWRTPPLWGLGDYIDVNGHTQLLHDGRARNVYEAILWHGGEGSASRNATLQLDDTDKKQLLSFLESL